MNLPVLSSEHQGHLNDGLITCRKHPTKNLWILNYTPQVQFDRAWDDVTMNCRGRVIDESGNTIALPFKKFFNLGEHTSPSLAPIPYGMPFKAYEKLDGSLGICFFFDGKWRITTRGSFESEQGRKGQYLLETYDLSLLDKNYTYLFEILCEESKVVVRYDREELVLLGAIETSTGFEKYPEEIHGLPFRKPRLFEVGDLSELKMSDNNFEGYVIKYDNGLRVKVKLDEYLRLHKLICGMTAKRLWQALMNEDNVDDMIVSLPDELYKEASGVVRKLRLGHGWEVFKYENTFLELRLGGMSRKEQAQKIISFCKENKEFSSSIFFSLLDGKKGVAHTQCWKMVEPDSNERILK